MHIQEFIIFYFTKLEMKEIDKILNIPEDLKSDSKSITSTEQSIINKIGK